MHINSLWSQNLGLERCNNDIKMPMEVDTRQPSRVGLYSYINDYIHVPILFNPLGLPNQATRIFTNNMDAI